MSIKQKSNFWNISWLIASLVAIGVATLSPYSFTIPTGFSGEYIFQEFRFGSNLKDYWQNVLLFLPFGFSLVSLTTAVLRHQLTTGNTLAFALFASILLSGTIEITQLFLPSRISNLSDIINNGLGGLLGGIFGLWRREIGRLIRGILTQDRRLLSSRSLLGAIAGYCTIVSLMIIALLGNINLSNWDNDFYLTIGNRTTGNLPWNGQISSLYISDRGLDRDIQAVFQQPEAFFAQSPNLVTSFNFVDEQNYYLDRSQHIGSLQWQYSQPAPATNYQREQNGGVWINSGQWLQTKEAATPLNQKLAKTSEFTLYTAIYSHKSEQFGPARIMALSKGAYDLNILLGQSGQDLSLRLRTSLGGSSGNQPEFIVPKVFASSDVCQILIIFARKKLDVYLNSERTKYSFTFATATGFLTYLPWKPANSIVNLAEFSPKFDRLILFLFLATPASILIITLLRYLIPQRGY